VADKKKLAGLKQLQRRIDRWRSSREKLHPMPSPLWSEAAALARELGVNPVRSALGLNYESLKKHTEDEGAEGGRETGIGKFVELSGAQVLGLPAADGPVVEVSDASGARLTVRLAAGSELDVARLVAAFRGRPE
jgi:hypothetical protein